MFFVCVYDVGSCCGGEVVVVVVVVLLVVLVGYWRWCSGGGDGCDSLVVLAVAIVVGTI